LQDIPQQWHVRPDFVSVRTKMGVVASGAHPKVSLTVPTPVVRVDRRDGPL